MPSWQQRRKIQAARSRKSYAAHRDAMRAKSRAYIKAVRDRMKAAGICVACWLEPSGSYTRCLPCRVKQAAVLVRWRARQKAA